MELNKHIVKKYNRLFREVSEYYGIEDEIFLWPFSKYVLSTIGITRLGYKGGPLLYGTMESRNVTITFLEERSATIRFLEGKYPHLVPFYILFFEMCNPDTEDYVCAIALHRINAVITAIRNEKKILSTSNTCGEIALENTQQIIDEYGECFR